MRRHNPKSRNPRSHNSKSRNLRQHNPKHQTLSLNTSSLSRKVVRRRL